MITIIVKADLNHRNKIVQLESHIEHLFHASDETHQIAL